MGNLGGTNKIPKQKGVLIVGLDGGGKTTILYQLKLGEIVSTIPTVGFNFETIEFKGTKFNLRDVGGQISLRSHWRKYYESGFYIIFTIDSNDRSSIKEAKEELADFLTSIGTEEVPILVFANKKDLPNTMTSQEIEKGLEMQRYSDSHPWFVQPCTALSGEGLYEGLEWLISDPPLNPVRFSKAKSAMK